MQNLTANRNPRDEQRNKMKILSTFIVLSLGLISGADAQSIQIYPFNAPPSGYQQSGVTILNVFGSATNPAVLVGPNAGAALPSNATFATAVGFDALQRSQDAGGENVAVGTQAMQFANGVLHTTAVGLHAIGFDTSGDFNTAFGNDAMRDTVAINNSTALGKAALYANFGQQQTAAGFGALFGNSSSVLVGGTATNGDVISLIFTGTSIPNSPVTVSYTVAGGDSVSVMAAGLQTAISANANLIAQVSNVFAFTDSVLPGRIALAWNGTGTIGTTIAVTTSITGAATETLAVTTGSGQSGARYNIAVGYNALIGYAMTTATDNIGIGAQSGEALTTGANNILMGTQAGTSLTTSSDTIAIGVLAQGSATGTQNVSVGSQSLRNATGSSSTAIGYLAGQNITSGGTQTLIGNAAGRNLTSGGNNTAIGSSALLGTAASTASFNVAIGDSALANVTSATQNTVAGHNTGNAITSGGFNVLLGDNVASTTLTTGTDNIMICTGHTACDVAANATSNTFKFQGNSANPFMTVTGTNAPTSAIATISGPLVFGGTKFTTSGCSVSATTGNGTSGTYTSGTAGTCTVVITMNGANGMTAPTGWACAANDLTTPADKQGQTVSTTTTATIAGTTVSGDVVNFHCMPY